MKLRDTTDARFLIEKLGMPPLQNMTEMKEALLTAESGDWGCIWRRSS